MSEEPKARLLEAAKGHVVFDGWSEATFLAAAKDCGMDPDDAYAICPNGAADLAVAFHRLGDDQLAEWAAQNDLSQLRYSARVARLVECRLEIAADKEMVRRGMTLFAMPVHLAKGSSLLWGTADRIWTILGDTSRDGNWYSKRAILSSVYAASVLYWLGDESAEGAATREFIDRRIANVMQFEKTKAGLRDTKAFAPLVSFLSDISGRIQAPSSGPRQDYPGWVAEDAGTKK